MTPERSAPISEIAEILVAGVMRVLARKSSEFSPTAGETSLDLPGHQSSHPTPLSGRRINE